VSGFSWTGTGLPKGGHYVRLSCPASAGPVRVRLKADTTFVCRVRLQPDTRSRSYGNANPGTSENITTQLLSDLRLELDEGPTAQDRPHACRSAACSTCTADAASTPSPWTATAASGAPAVPAICNSIWRAGYRFAVGRRSLDLFVDALNLTNRSNYFNPEGDARLSNFLIVTALQGNGPTRTAQLECR
jgi:hypothetical protein